MRPALRPLPRRACSSLAGAAADSELGTAEAATAAGKVAQEAGAGKSSVTQTYFTMFKSFIGLGVLALPRAFQQAGYIGGAGAAASMCCAWLRLCSRSSAAARPRVPTVGMAVVALVSFHCMMSLLQCRSLLLRAGTHGAQGAQVTFSDVGQAALGSAGAWAVDVSLVVSQVRGVPAAPHCARARSSRHRLTPAAAGALQIGFSTAYLIFIGHNVQVVVAEVTTLHTSSLPYILACVLVLVPLSWLRSLRRLAWSALLADVAVLVGLLTVYAYATAGLASHHVPVRVSATRAPPRPALARPHRRRARGAGGDAGHVPPLFRHRRVHF